MADALKELNKTPGFPTGREQKTNLILSVKYFEENQSDLPGLQHCSLK